MDPNADADAEEHEPLSSIMSDHFYIAAWARDTVVYGDIDALREPLASLAHYQYPPEMPAGVSELQAAAALTAKADNLAAAAAGIAAMARVCGECHRKLGLGIVAKQRPIDTSTPNKVDAISGRMFRHGWAAERLWEGLVAPSDQAWTAGAAALAHAPMRTPKTKQPVTEKFAQSLRAIRDLGARASIATSMEERTNIYAQTLATCAQCHADNVVFASKR
jgi:mono/diheme cytochrome c family protein